MRYFLGQVRGQRARDPDGGTGHPGGEGDALACLVGRRRRCVSLSEGKPVKVGLLQICYSPELQQEFQGVNSTKFRPYTRVPILPLMVTMSEAA